ncbi:ABC transporter transmembrane domain-containing protein [Thalassospira lucentensis]|uniref:ABC transporter transmembrane domain-containing protein n=1 Tax=Thalassospira lucentensis TaxID=168935 RepID=UPI00294288F7|nr:ABC transporter transmembrane domain-containing protein [Thalassospira lucentensis]WOI11374.1 ABC transporter transmembrane domain-containing protein [Thalassospira lucentensis]
MALNPRTSPRLADRDSSRNFSALRAIIPFVLPYRLQVAGAMVALVIASGTVLALGSGLRMLVDRGFADGNADLLDQALFVLFAVTLLMAGASYARFFLVSWIGERVVADIRSAVYAHIIRLDPGFFEVTRTGEVLSRLTTDTTLLQVVIGSSVSIALRNILMFVGGLTMLAVTSPKLTALVLLVVPLVVVPIIGYGRRVRRLSREAQDRIADVSAFSEESLNALRTVQAYTHEKIESDKFDGFVEGAFKTAISRISARALLTAVVIVMVFGAVGTILWIGGHDVLDGTISAGDLSAFVFYAIVVAGSVGAISEVIGDLQRAAGAAERLMGLLETKPAIAAPANPVQMPEKHLGHVSFENVTFHYPARPDRSALTGFSLQVKPGETVALVGPSGAGKTTVFQLLLRFYDPASGVIKVDDVDIRTADPVSVRERIGLVAQDPVIFAANAWENIRYGRPDASDEDVRAAADAAHATEFLDRLPDGFDSFLGEKGVRLSGGQRQRIAIARAILRNPSVLLLDEATSALDAESEQVVQKALETIMKTRTTLVIAHRLATVLHADRIAVIDDGKLIAVGTHQELLESSPLYSRLAKLQFERDAA